MPITLEIVHTSTSIHNACAYEVLSDSRKYTFEIYGNHMFFHIYDYLCILYVVDIFVFSHLYQWLFKLYAHVYLYVTFMTVKCKVTVTDILHFTAIFFSFTTMITEVFHACQNVRFSKCLSSFE